LTLKFRSIVYDNSVTFWHSHSISESHTKHKCVLSYPNPWDVSHRNDIPMDKPGNRCRRQILGGAKDFCPNFPKLARKKLQRKWLHFLQRKTAYHFLLGASFWSIILPGFPNLARKNFKNGTLTKMLFVSIRASFLVNSGAIIFKSKHIGRHFCSDFHLVLEGSQIFLPDFREFCPDFHQIKNFGGAVAPLSPLPPIPEVTADSGKARSFILC